MTRRPFALALGLAAGIAAACESSRQAHDSAPAEKATPSVERLPAGRHGHRLEIVEGRLAAFGGYSAGGADDRGCRETWLFDLTHGGWRRGPDLNLEHSFAESVNLDGKVYAIGNDIETLDAGCARWSLVAPAGTVPTSHFGAAALGRTIYALGGFPEIAGGFAGFDLDTGKSVDPPEPPDFVKGQHFHVVATLEGELHAIGGIGGPQFEISRAHWIFDGKTWREGVAAPLPVWRKFAVVQVVDDSLYFFEEGRGLRYDARRRQWSFVKGLPRSYAMPASVRLGRTIVVLGGVRIDERGNDFLIYDLDTDAWREVPPTSKPSPAAKGR